MHIHVSSYMVCQRFAQRKSTLTVRVCTYSCHVHDVHTHKKYVQLFCITEVSSANLSYLHNASIEQECGVIVILRIKFTIPGCHCFMDFVRFGVSNSEL